MKLERLSCRRRVALLCDYLDKELPASERKIIAEHRRSCRPCSLLLASLQRTVRTLRKLKTAAKTPESARRKLRAALARRPGS
ncbi:MAG: anti-sigma factor family protein [Elusimicrobiota bacterium]